MHLVITESAVSTLATVAQLKCAMGDWRGRIWQDDHYSFSLRDFRANEGHIPESTAGRHSVLFLLYKRRANTKGCAFNPSRLIGANLALSEGHYPSHQGIF